MLVVRKAILVVTYPQPKKIISIELSLALLQLFIINYYLTKMLFNNFKFFVLVAFTFLIYYLISLVNSEFKLHLERQIRY